MRRTNFQIAEEKALNIAESLSHNPSLSFSKLNVKGAWVWARPENQATEKFILNRGFFRNPKFPGWYCLALIALKHKSTTDSIKQIDQRYGCIELNEEVA